MSINNQIIPNNDFYVVFWGAFVFAMKFTNLVRILACLCSLFTRQLSGTENEWSDDLSSHRLRCTGSFFGDISASF